MGRTVKRTTHGVPQGSISGPLLFDLYINEISNTCPYCDIKSCADDSKLILSFAIKDLSDGVGKLDADLKNVAVWCCCNSLLINPDKIKFLLFGSRQALASKCTTNTIFRRTVSTCSFPFGCNARFLFDI